MASTALTDVTTAASVTALTACSFYTEHDFSWLTDVTSATSVTAAYSLLIYLT
jgi:hypothetical protein